MIRMTTMTIISTMSWQTSSLCKLLRCPEVHELSSFMQKRADRGGTKACKTCWWLRWRFDSGGHHSPFISIITMNGHWSSLNVCIVIVKASWGPSSTQLPIGDDVFSLWKYAHWTGNGHHRYCWYKPPVINCCFHLVGYGGEIPQPVSNCWFWSTDSSHPLSFWSACGDNAVITTTVSNWLGRGTSATNRWTHGLLDQEWHEASPASEVHSEENHWHNTWLHWNKASSPKWSSFKKLKASKDKPTWARVITPKWTLEVA